MSFDVKIIGTGNGGDFVSLGNDIATTKSIAGMIYMALFGGNVEQVTEQKRTVTQDQSWWGNKLFMSDTPNQQFNSVTEKTLKETPLSAAAVNTITNAINEDLKFIAKVFTIVVVVQLVYVDHVRISLTVTDPTTAKENVLIINIRKIPGDFSILDFDESDFFI